MKRKLIGAVLIIILALAVGSSAILASDISGALYKMSILVSNNGTLANYVSTNTVVSTDDGWISTDNLQAGGFLNASANNCAVLASGNDVAFMPGYSTNPWVFWVETIGSDAYLNYSLYTHNTTGGKLAYFPTATGMIVSDNATLELGDDFDIEVVGWVDTEYGASKYVLEKTEAFSVRISATANITAGIFGSAAYNPDAHPETNSVDGDVVYTDLNGVDWNVIHDALAGMTADDAGVLAEARIKCDANLDKYDKLERIFLLFDTSPIPNGVTIFSATLQVKGTTKQDTKPWGDSTINVFASSPANVDALVIQDYDEVGTTALATPITYAAFDAAGWNTFTLNAAGLAAINDTGVTELSLREATYDAPDLLLPYDANSNIIYQIATADSVGNEPILTVWYAAAEVTAINQAPDEYNVHVSANTTNLTISIDGATSGDGYDTIALAGASVPDKNSDWEFCLNDAMPYMLSANVIVAGNSSAWIWQYDTIFYDSIGANDATPSLRTDSSDADVVAAAISFQPIEEAKAPAWTLDETTATWYTAANVSGNFTTTPSPTYPGADIIEDIAAASGTPAQLPFIMIVGFITLAVSLTVSYVLRQYGSRSLFVKVIVVAGMLLIFETLGIVDLWMLVFYLIIALAVMAASKQGSIT